MLGLDPGHIEAEGAAKKNVTNNSVTQKKHFSKAAFMVGGG